MLCRLTMVLLRLTGRFRTARETMEARRRTRGRTQVNSQILLRTPAGLSRRSCRRAVASQVDSMVVFAVIVFLVMVCGMREVDGLDLKEREVYSLDHQKLQTSRLHL